MNRREHDQLQQSKRDLSWQRYDDGWSDIRDRYDVTVALVQGPDMLDIGCGQCLLGHLLAQRRPDIKRYVGLDDWDEMLSEAKERGDFELWHGDAGSLPFGEGEFNSVVLGQVLEHVWDDRVVAREAMRVLRTGGRLIVNVPADDAEPHGNHVRVFETMDEMKVLFDPFIRWDGEGRLHRYWFSWGRKCG